MMGALRAMLSSHPWAPMTLEQVQITQVVAQQVVLAVEQTLRTDGARKKELAIQVLSAILADQQIRPPLLVLDTAIEASVRLLKELRNEK